MAEPKKVLPANPMPKEEFQVSPGAMKAHRALLELPQFQLAVRVAQAQYCRICCAASPTNLDSPNQLQASAMCFQRIQGMNDFINVLLNLAETPRLPPRRTDDNLAQL